MELPLPDAKNYVCVVENFVIGHATLTIRASSFDGSNNYYIIFGGVAYYSGAISWESADFQLEPAEECRKILDNLPRFKNTPKEHLNEIHNLLYKLYKVRTDNHEVSIVAYSANISEIPSS